MFVPATAIMAAILVLATVATVAFAFIMRHPRVQFSLWSFILGANLALIILCFVRLWIVVQGLYRASTQVTPTIIQGLWV